MLFTAPCLAAFTEINNCYGSSLESQFCNIINNVQNSLQSFSCVNQTRKHLGLASNFCSLQTGIFF